MLSKIRSSRRALAAGLVALAVLVFAGAGVFAVIPAFRTSGVQITSNATTPIQATKQGVWVDTAGTPQLRYDDGTTSNVVAAVNATTKGDLACYTGSAWTKLAAGSNTQLLTADSTQTCGVKWAAAAGGSGYSEVDNNGAAVTARSKLNFDGTLLVATDNGASTRTDITAPGLLALTGGTMSGNIVLGANVGITGTAGTGPITLGSLTGATTMPTGNFSWSGATNKTWTLTGGTGATFSMHAAPNQGYFDADSGSARVGWNGSTTGVSVDSAKIRLGGTNLAVDWLFANDEMQPVNDLDLIIGDSTHAVLKADINHVYTRTVSWAVGTGAGQYTLLAGLGTTGAVSNMAGGDEAGVLTLTAGGATIAAGAQIDIYFKKTYPTAPSVIVVGRDSNTLTQDAWYADSTTTKMTIYSAYAPGSGTANKLQWQVKGWE